MNYVGNNRIRKDWGGMDKKELELKGLERIRFGWRGLDEKR